MTRRGLRKALPALAMHYGVLPWHLDPEPPVLTRGEVQSFVDHYLKMTDLEEHDG